jgi:hypothetical protein
MFVILSSTTPPPRSLFKTKAPCWMPALIVADATYRYEVGTFDF